MTINPNSTRVAVTDEATAIIEDESKPVGVKEDGRVTYVISNTGGSDVYVGDDELDDTGDTGLPIPSGATLTIALRMQAKLYGICANGESSEVAILQVP